MDPRFVDAASLLSDVPGVGELRVALGEWGDTLYVILETKDVERDFAIVERLSPLRIEYEIVPKHAVGMIPPGETL